MKYGSNTAFFGAYQQRSFSTLAEFLEIAPKQEHRCYYCRHPFEEGQEFKYMNQFGDDLYYHKDCYRDLMRQYSQ